MEKVVTLQFGIFDDKKQWGPTDLNNTKASTTPFPLNSTSNMAHHAISPMAHDPFICKGLGLVPFNGMLGASDLYHYLYLEKQCKKNINIFNFKIIIKH